MDYKWNRFRLLLFITFLRNVSGFKGWAYLNTQPQWSKPYQYTFSPRGVQSPGIGSVPFEVGSVFNRRNQNPSRSRTQFAPSGLSSASWALPQSEHNLGSSSSLLKLQGPSRLNVQNIASQPVSRWGSHKYTDSWSSSEPQSARISAPSNTQGGLSFQSQSSPGTAVSQSSSQALSRVPSRASTLSPSQLVSKQIGSGIYSSLSPSQRNYFKPFSSSSRGFESQLSASSRFAQEGSRSSSQFQGTQSQFIPGSTQYMKMTQSQMPQRWQPSTSLTQGIQTPQTSHQSQTISSSYTPKYPMFGSSTLGVSSQSSSDQRSSGLYTSSSQRRAGVRKAASSHVSAQEGESEYPVSVSDLYNQENPSGPSRFPKRQTSAARLTQGVQASGTGAAVSPRKSQSSYIPSSMSFQSSAENPSQFVSRQAGGSSYGGSSPQPSKMFCPFMPGNAKLSRSGQSSDETLQPRSSKLLYIRITE